MVSGHSRPWGQRPRHLHQSDSPSLGSKGKDIAMVKHNDVMVRHTDLGRFAYIWKEYKYNRHWEMFITSYGDYLCGHVPPNYPVPALRDQMNLAHPVVLWFHEYIDEHGVAPD